MTLPANDRVTDPDALVEEARCQRVGSLLARSHGYLVRGARGEPLGRIAALRYGLDDRWPTALILRPHGLRGLWSGTTWELPFSAVGTVVSELREVRVLREGPRREHAAPQGLPEAVAQRGDAPARRRFSGSEAAGADRSGSSS